MWPSRRHTLVISRVLVAALVFVAAACGEDGGAGDEGDAPPADCRVVPGACTGNSTCGQVEVDRWACVSLDADASIVSHPDLGGTWPDARVWPDVYRPPISDPPDAAPPPEAEPGGPCNQHVPCLRGVCQEAPGGGFCRIGCVDDVPCGANAACAFDTNGSSACFVRCVAGTCRVDWSCDVQVVPSVCRPDCHVVPCPDNLVCDESGLCVEEAPCRAETCNGRDDDCDGDIDEGVRNACGACGSLPTDRCDGHDEDCDGVTDEDARCGPGRACIGGECVALGGPADPCRAHIDCESGACATAADAGWPGGFCVQSCVGHEQCGRFGVCIPAYAYFHDAICFDRCGDPYDDCRIGWICNQGLVPESGVCMPSCQSAPCPEGLVCDRQEQSCREPRVIVTVEQAVISPGTVEGSEWDGNDSISPEVRAAVMMAVGTPEPLAAVLNVLADPAFESLSEPDPGGTARLLVDGVEVPGSELVLEVRHNTFAPVWGVSWAAVSFAPEADLRVRMELWDDDVVIDDEIGMVTISVHELRAALDARDSMVVVTTDQGAGRILLVSFSVTEVH